MTITPEHERKRRTLARALTTAANTAARLRAYEAQSALEIQAYQDLCMRLWELQGALKAIIERYP